MKLVYDLRSDLDKNPERVKQAQAMTLNSEKPLLGLKGSHGLFASAEWWNNIETGKIPKKTITGKIEEMFFAGQDSRWGDQVNSFTLRLPDGSHVSESIYTNQKADRRLFRVGAVVCFTYVFDELKKQPSRDGAVNYAQIVLEVAISSTTSKGAASATGG